MFGGFSFLGDVLVLKDFRHCQMPAIAEDTRAVVTQRFARQLVPNSWVLLPQYQTPDVAHLVVGRTERFPGLAMAYDWNIHFACGGETLQDRVGDNANTSSLGAGELGRL